MKSIKTEGHQYPGSKEVVTAPLPFADIAKSLMYANCGTDHAQKLKRHSKMIADLKNLLWRGKRNKNY